jgi:hypothetical protein
VTHAEAPNDRVAGFPFQGPASEQVGEDGRPGSGRARGKLGHRLGRDRLVKPGAFRAADGHALGREPTVPGVALFERNSDDRRPPPTSWHRTPVTPGGPEEIRASAATADFITDRI